MHPAVTCWVRRARQINLLSSCLLAVTFVPLTLSCLADNAVKTWPCPAALWFFVLFALASLALPLLIARPLARAPYGTVSGALATDDPRLMCPERWSSLRGLAVAMPCYLSVMLPGIAAEIIRSDETPFAWRLACVAAWAAAACVAGLYTLAVFRLARAAGSAQCAVE